MNFSLPIIMKILIIASVEVSAGANTSNLKKKNGSLLVSVV